MKIIDISTDLLTAEVYPGDPEPRLHLINRMDCDDEYNLSAIYACLHTGTHADAPSHVFDDEDTATVTDLPLSKFIGPVTVLDLPAGPITGQTVERYFPRMATKLILRSDGPIWFFGGAAEDVAGLEYDLIGFEGISIAQPETEIDAHRALLGAGTVLLEGLDLSSVGRAGEYFLFAPPVKMAGREASFVRAVLIEDRIMWSPHSY